MNDKIRLSHIFPHLFLMNPTTLSSFDSPQLPVYNHQDFLFSCRTRSPPALTRKLSREALEAHDQVMNNTKEAGGDGIGLSRTSALNNRYFDDKNKSRSLDNLLEGPPDIQVS